MASDNQEKNETRLQYYLDAHHRLFIALGVSMATYFIFRNMTTGPQITLVAWVSFAFSVIIPNWIIILTAHPRDVKAIARIQDSSRSIIFLFVIVAALASLFSIVYLLTDTKGGSHAEVTKSVLLTMGSVITSWWLVHTIFTMRYAHAYYDTSTDDGKPLKKGGLEFPNEKEPDYLDFVYFSFVIGMTFQVSDVEISSRPIRRLALLHSLISFLFNTAIVALSINVVSGLAGH